MNNKMGKEYSMQGGMKSAYTIFVFVWSYVMVI
jgi:hypothetical protein